VYYNYLEIFKTLTLISAILVSFYIYRTINLEVVFYAYLISYIVPFVIGFYWLIPFFKAKKQETNLRLIVVDSLKYGFQIQLNNISQMINYRFSFFLIEKLKGKAELGVFSVALSLSEAIWIICKSIATFQYSKLVNTTDRTEQKRITLLSLHLSFYATLPLIVLLLLLPDSFFNLLFGKDFDSLKIILLALSLGILELSYFTIINHYFTGIGKNKINVIGSIIGNTVTIFACSFLIPILGSFGAGLATSLTYLFMLIYLVLQFKKESQVSILELLPSLLSIRTVLKNRSL
jgi:O-antigen/teichoic acid export membrane protein